MTQKELSQVYYLNREIESHKRRLYELREQLREMGIVDGVQGSDDEQPFEKRNHIIRGPEISPRAEALRDLIWQRKVLISECKAKCEAQKLEIEKYIAEIPDSLTRQIFTLYCVELHTWQEVAQIVGGGNTADGVRMIVKRFLKS